MGGLGPKVDENLVPEQLQALFQFLEGQYFCEPEQSLINHSHFLRTFYMPRSSWEQLPGDS